MIGLSEKELEAVLAERCASFGVVKKLRVYLPTSDSCARPFVLVDMETPEQAERLAAEAGRLTLDNAVVIFLQHDRTGVPVPGPVKHRADGSTVSYPPLILD